MTTQEILQEVKHFPVDERVALIQQISQTFLSETNKNNRSSPNRNLTVEEKIAIVESLHGSLRPAPGQLMPMTKAEVREIVTEALMEKYL